MWTQVAFERPLKLQRWQREAFRLMGSGSRLSIASCNGAGKSWLAVLMMLHYLTTRVPTKVVVTAGSANQLSDVLWSEGGAMIGRMVPFFRDSLLWRTDKIELVGRQDCFAVARTSRREQPDALQGHHAENMLFILDEASGIPNIILEVAKGSLSTPGAKIVAPGNPLRRSGWFYDTFTNPKISHLWQNMHIAANEELAREYGVKYWAEHVSDDLVSDLAETYGVESGQFRARALGLFPLADADVLIPGNLVEGAFRRDVVTDYETSVWGVDVARFGSDRSTMCKRRGRVIEEPIAFVRGHDTMEVSGWVKREYDACQPSKRPVEILIDAIGYGAGVVDRLRELGLPAVGINVSEQPSTKTEYMRLRDELWGRCRDWFAGKDVYVPEDQELLTELTGPTYTFESTGRMKVEGKPEMKKRLGFSPDKADALCLTFAGTAATMAGGASVPWRKGKALKRSVVGIC